MVTYLNQLYNYLDFNICFFNLICFSSGLFVLIYDLKSSINNNKIEDCNNIYLLSAIITLNSLFSLFIISHPYLSIISILCFISSTTLLTYNIITYNKIQKTCIDYYKNNHIEIWIYYNCSLGVLAMNVLCHLIKSVVILNMFSESNERLHRFSNISKNYYYNNNDNNAYESKLLLNNTENKNIHEISEYKNKVDMLDEKINKIYPILENIENSNINILKINKLDSESIIYEN